MEQAAGNTGAAGASSKPAGPSGPAGYFTLFGEANDKTVIFPEGENAAPSTASERLGKDKALSKSLGGLI